MTGDPPEFEDVAPGEASSSLLSPQDESMLAACFRGDMRALADAYMLGANFNAVDGATGLSALHIATGSNDYEMCQILIQSYGAGFFPDRFGRWPSVVALECGASEHLCVYIAEQEERYLARTPPEGPEERTH